MVINRLARKRVYMTVTAVRVDGHRPVLTEVEVAVLPRYRKPIPQTIWTTCPLVDDTAVLWLAGPDVDEPGDILVTGRGIDLWVRVHDNNETDLAFVERVEFE